MKWAEHEICMKEMGTAHKYFKRKSEEIRPLARTRLVWEKTVNSPLRNKIFVCVDWIILAQDKAHLS
jgi:hypothetical protein